MMDNSNDFDFTTCNANETLSIQHIGSQSEDEVSLTEQNVDELADEESIYKEMLPEDDDDFGGEGSSSEIEMPPTPLEGKGSDVDDCNSSKSNLNSEYNKNEPTIKCEESNSPPTHYRSNKRSSGRLRKEGKVPMTTKNLFPGRPRNFRSQPKFASSTILNFPENVPMKSPSVSNQEVDNVETKPLVVTSTLSETVICKDQIESKITFHSTETIVQHETEIISTSSTSQENLVQNSEKIATAKKKLNYSGKIKGKLSGRRNKTMEYRKKRGPKGTNIVNNVVGVTENSNDKHDKHDDSGIENKIILCSSKDNFVLTQDVCVMCGSFGTAEEGRLLSCAQCGQCYHPFCAGIKLTRIMLKKGWRCLECTVCEGCGKPTDESRLLLCDDCDISYHTYCLDPPLEEVPGGTWKCQWCVVCVKCRSTSPGYRSHWQENYTLCGPCASLEKCSACQNHYIENELIIECIQCRRWLHSKCDSMFDENECEIASSIGYHCINCRPANEPPPHIQARKNGTLRSIFNKKRAEERNDPVLMKKSEAQKENLDGNLEFNENTVNTSSKLLSKYHLVDGVYLSEAGLIMIKSQAVEQPKKTRVKRKNAKDEQDETSNKEFEENGDDNGDKQTEEEKKKRLRRLRLEKLGIGGFHIKQRGRLSFNKEDDETSQDNCERSVTPDNQDKPRRRRRKNQKKNQLQDQYPSYLQEAFFGKNLLDVITSNGNGSKESELHLSENESEDDEQKQIGTDKIVNLNSLDIAQNMKNKNDDINFLYDNLQAENFDDLALSPDDVLVDMFINENLGRNDDEVLNELSVDANVAEKDDAESKIVMEDILDSNFNFNELDNSGLPQMDSKDVEDLFEVMSNSSLPPTVATPAQIVPPPPPSKEYQSADNQNANPVTMMQTKPTVEPLDLPMISNKSDLSGASTPITPLSSESLSSLQQQFSSFDSNQSMPNHHPYKMPSQQPPTMTDASNQQQGYYMPTVEPETETTSQGQKNYVKWESEEALGQCATISAVLYANIKHPNLKTEYPIWADRIKQIHKIWRQLSPDQRQPYLQMARDNRSANKKNQAEMMNKMNKKLNDNDKQWKDMSNPNSASILNGSNMNAVSSMPSQSNEIGYPIQSDYGHPSNKIYPAVPPPSMTPMHSGPPPSPAITQMSPSQMMMNMQQQPSTQSPLHQSPISPAIHSPRLRGFVENYPQQVPPQSMNQHNQMNMMRPSTMVPTQGSFSPNSSLNAVHGMGPASECYQSSPNAGQRPQSVDVQPHGYGGQNTSPYGGPRTPFSPNHAPHQPGMHGTVVANDPYLMSNASAQPNMDNVDVYKSNLSGQTHSKPHTPDSSYMQSMSGSSLPSTPQPPPSPQLPVPSPITDMYARSPTAARPPNTGQAAVVRQSSQFDDNYNQQRQPSELYSPSPNPNTYSPQYIQQQQQGGYLPDASGFNNGPPPGTTQDANKMPIRPNMMTNVPNRPNIPIRRAIPADSYVRQALPTNVDDNDPHSKQHLRNLLQVQQMRRQDSPTSSTSGQRSPWPENNNTNNNSFRQPMSPALNRNKLPIQTGSPNQTGPYQQMDPNFRFNNDQQQQRMIMHRNPGDIRFRQAVPNAQQQFVRYSQQQQMQMKGPSMVQKLPQQQQWATTPPANSPSMSPRSNQMQPNQMNLQVVQQMPTNASASGNFQSQTSIANVQQQIKQEIKTENKDIKPPEVIGNDDVEEPLPVELADDDELLNELGNDFNILEYADPELDDKTVSGHSGKSNIFDELDEKDIISNDKDNETKNDKANNSAVKNDNGNDLKQQTSSNNDQQQQQVIDTFSQVNYNNNNNNNPDGNRIFVQNKTNAAGPNHQMIDQTNIKHETQLQQQQPYFQANLSNSECFMSDDDFERLLNDSDQMNAPTTTFQCSPQMNPNPVYGPSPAGQTSMQSSASHHNSASMVSPSHHQQQPNAYQAQQHQYNPSMNPGTQPVWQTDKQPMNRMSYPNRMHIRMPMNQTPPPHMARHMQPRMYVGQSGNRVMLQQQQPMPMSNPNPMMRPSMANVGPPPPPTDNESYDMMQQQQNMNNLLQRQKQLETEVAKFRKIKKSLNAKQRQCRKNQNELNENDANELARVTHEIGLLQKQLDNIRKIVRQNNVIQDKRKSCQNTSLPHSPSTQTSPRSVNSPMAVLNTSGPGTPLGICPSTPQSPSLTSQSPSSLMQTNSPISSLHSPASMMPLSPMPNNQNEMSVRPQIVQEDNNPFSDVYLQKEKKQTMQPQQPGMYSNIQPMAKDPMNSMVDQRQTMYGSNAFDDNVMQPGPSQQQQYYHGPPGQQTAPPPPPQPGPQSFQMMRSNFGNNPNTYRFQTGPMNTHFGNPPMMNYQQIRRPPPPPYPGNAQQQPPPQQQHYVGSRPMGGAGYPPPPPPQNQPPPIRMQQPMRSNSLECNINAPPMTPTHSMYSSEGNSPMIGNNDQSYQMTNPVMGAVDPTMPIVDDDAAVEFNINETGNGHDNESDPFTFLKEQEQNKSNGQTSSDSTVSNNVNNEIVIVPTSSSGMINNDNNVNNDSSSSSTNHLNNNETNDGMNVEDQQNRQINKQNSQELVASVDNSEDDSTAIKQNALLKKLLQNCPSADLKSMNSNNQENQDQDSQPMDVVNCDTVPNEKMEQSINETRTETDNQQINESQDLSSMSATITTTTTATNVTTTTSETDQITKNTTTTTTTTTPITPVTPVVVEKKLSYLDIRRAQLEREPTPPLEDIKPKRKRTVKRKESNKSNDGDSVDNSTNSSMGKTKKRNRKGSQTKNDDSMDSTNNNEKIMNHFRTLPPVPLIEPEVKMNMNVCMPPDALDFNLKNPILKGCYGNASLSSAIDYYSTYPFGPNKASSIVAPNNNNTNRNSKVSYYNEEFGLSIMDFKENVKDRHIKTEFLSLYSRDVDSPETVVSASSPECVLYDHPKDEYNRMKYINDNVDSDDEEPKSPFLTFLPIRPLPVYSCKELTENNKENIDGEDIHQKSKLLKVNSGCGPLKESNNVGITIMINPEYNVKDVMKALAKLLKLKSTFTYNIEKSPTSRITEVLEIMNDSENGAGGSIYCKFCNCLIKDQGYKAEESRIDISTTLGEDCFCNKECFKNYALSNVNIVHKDKMLDNRHRLTDDDSMTCDEMSQNDPTEQEVASILNQGSEHGTDELDSVISIHEKHWKNTRYLYWNDSVFKNDNHKVQTAEEEPVEDILDRYDICLKPSANNKDKRCCIFCQEIGDGNEDGPSRLLNMDVDKWVHLNCALWSNEVYEMLNGTLMNVDQAYQRAMNSICVKCAKFGASLKCFKLRCNNSYHFPCAIQEKCVFYQDKSLLCPVHSTKGPLPLAEEMNSFVVARKVYINRDEQKQIAAMLHQDDNNLLRIGSLTFLNIGQLMTHQLQNFHSHSYIYPVGYKVSRFYWSMRKLQKRCQYICSIEDVDGYPQFSVEVREDGFENVIYKAKTPKLAWQPIIESIVKLREETQTIKVFFNFISGEDLFGLNEPTIVRILESLPGVEKLADYNFKYGRSPWYEMPLAINPSGCARTEPKKRFHFKRPHTLHVSSNTSRSSLQSPLTNSESTSPYVKQFVHSKVSQYRKMKLEWRNNVYLGRSRISGLGLYAYRDIEKHTMIIEYIGLVIRNSIADRNERIHEAHNRGIYMFRLDDNRVIDATLQGGLARYVNHSCDPNCVAECVQIDRENKILIIANRRIHKGEELTYDYKFDVEDDQHKIPCLCGAANCRKWMN